MGSFVSTDQFVELPFKGEKLEFLGNIISFDENTTNDEIINTIVKSNCNRIQTSREPNENEILILNEIYKIKPNIGFRFLIMFGPDVNISFLPKIYNLRTLYLDVHPSILNIDILSKLKLTKLSLSCFGVKDYSFLKNVDSDIKALTIDLNDKTYKMDINDIIHMKNLETLEIKNVKKGLDKLVEFKNLKSLLLRSININDYIPFNEKQELSM